MVRYAFVCGAPRSGTTFLSDWITESNDAYCVHEVEKALNSLQTSQEIGEKLHEYARTGSDRLDKVLQRRFLLWNTVSTKRAPRLLALKNPWVWVDAQSVSPGVRRFWDTLCSDYIVIIRHPYDVVASGIHRACHTENWPDIDVEKHCQLWLQCFNWTEKLIASQKRVLLIHWEQLVLKSKVVKCEIEQFLSIQLPEFEGNEVTSRKIISFKNNTSPILGYLENPKRSLLTSEMFSTVNSLLAIRAKDAGYVLSLK